MQWIFLWPTFVRLTNVIITVWLSVCLVGNPFICLSIHNKLPRNWLIRFLWFFCTKLEKWWSPFAKKRILKELVLPILWFLAWAQKGTSDEKEKNSDAPQMIHIYQQSGFPRNYPARSFRFFIKSKDHKWWKVLKSLR